MANNLIATSKIFIDSASQGNKYLRDVKAHSETDDSDIELAYGAGEQSAIGYIHKPTGGSLELEQYRRQGATLEVNFRTLLSTRETFIITASDTGGQRLQYGGCRVASVANDSDDQGSHMTKIKVVWATREAL